MDGKVNAADALYAAYAAGLFDPEDRHCGCLSHTPLDQDAGVNVVNLDLEERL